MKGGGGHFTRPGTSRAATCHFRALNCAMSRTRVGNRIVYVRVSVPRVSELVLSEHWFESLSNTFRDVVGLPVHHGEIAFVPSR